MKNRLFAYHLPPFLWAGAIYAASSVPLALPPVAGTFTDKIAHVIEYAILGFLAARSLSHVESPSVRKSALILAFVLSGLYGLSDEVHQSFVPHRGFDRMDLLADTVGSLAGAMMMALKRRSR